MKFNKNVLKALVLVTQLGLTMLTSMFLCMFLGMAIDAKFSTHFFLPFLILGIGGGMSGVYQLLKHAQEEDEN